ncbi:transmembrane protein 126A [Anopheles cruzii]|uniref:transmembrane protein 126A n=1 Tax=Anopheles cruzii TaxID=68878 RepID=UPI0022EC7F34|nr:transmembrane protein 126A [Anopheles cruzii]
MALVHKPASQVPQDAVRLSEEEALQYFLKLVKGWEQKGDVWPLRYTASILGVCSAISGFYFNNHYRLALRLGNYGRMSSYLPAVAIPAIMATAFHTAFVQPDVILRREPCPVCTQTRAAIIQGGFSVAYPLLLAPLSSFMFATRHFTYRLPSITEQPIAVLKLFRRLTAPIMMPITVLLACNLAISIALTGQEFQAVHRVNIRMLEIERQLENDGLLPAP